MDKEFVAKIVKNIRNLREKRGLTQLELALELGLTPGAIANIETLRSDITATRLNSIAKALGVEPYELLKFDENE